MVDQPKQIIVISPFDNPDAGVVAAASRAGALGVLDLGRDLDSAVTALDKLKSQAPETLGVRIAPSLSIEPSMFAGRVSTVILDAGEPTHPWSDFQVLVQVTSLTEARAAVEQGAAGLIAKGNESGGRVGDATSFVLLQSLVREIELPIWVQGGIGLNTAAACIAGGAAGVVLDSQVSLTRESSIPNDVKTAIKAMDGSETVVLSGYRVFTRPDLPVHELASQGDPAELFSCSDLRKNLLPAGQDAAFARPLADAYRTVGGIVKAIEKATKTQIASARRQLALSPASKLASELDIRFPIFQGPMTRVSDRAAFAEAVTDGGGLPFLALALMRGPEVQALLEETAQKLEGKTWGVGILGFVPPELREEQLEVVRRVKPPVALIAGGRPAQAKPLEEIGITTFLHVPSPGLLDMFLRQGARRFVFEGLECGGHVGPRSSFVLWQSQIERLLSHSSPKELSVIFAGGIHDARSAAMVAAMAAPLVERGVKIGVLMGTAYLTTQEAVATGAIQPAFQQATLECEETALLETAPGHATRCADTEFVRTFRAERARLEREGLESHQIWEKLEELNLGRLRIASKGLVREGNKIVSVDEETQRREGMVMLGQVAALRAEVTTIETLHQDVSEGSGEYLSQLQPAHETPQSARSTDVAIIGMSAIMPGAPDLETFWSNIVNGVNSITEVPPERWKAETFFDPTSMNGNMTPSKWGGFLDPVAFDPLTYGIPPLSLSAIEPVQLLALESSRRALADAGYLDREFDRENTSVIFGAEAGTDLAGAYGFRAMWRQYAGEIPAELDAVLPTLTEDSFPGILANVIAGRIANRLDLGGVNYTVDAACASSLAALDLACKELVSGTSEMVLCGGADFHNSVVDFLAFASVHALSATGQCRPFDASADGIALGEGVATVVLKRLADAERDGDRIYSVIKAVRGGSDGRSLGLTAPRAEGQVRTLARAYESAGGSPLEVELVEAHGTGTVVGDRTELETLNQFFGNVGAEAGSIALGSVKSQIGHTKCAAGLAGLIKASLSLYHRILPPTLNVTAPNPGWKPDSPFTINTGAKPWPGENRKAGVSAFGFGGTNFHTVVAEYAGSTAEAGVEQWRSELFFFRGNTVADAHKQIEALLKVIDAAEQPMKDLARSVSEGSAPVQVAVVARDLEDLRVKLSMAREGKTNSSGVFIAPSQPLPDAKLAFLFPGQGSQRVGMLNDLFTAFPDLQKYLSLGEPWRKKMFPPTAWSAADKDAQRDAITDTRVAQPTLGIAGLAAADLLAKLGIEADMLAGHSYGELVALSVAGAIPESALLQLSQLRGERILQACGPDSNADSGNMAAVLADYETTSKHLEGIDGVVVANENSPDQSVISGPTAGVATAMKRLEAAGLTARAIPVAAAFHSPMIRPACDVFAKDLDAVDIASPRQIVYSNTTTQPYPAEPASIRSMLAQHIGKPVRFASQIESMYAAGARIFVEVGPGRVLTGLVQRILGDRPYVAVNLDRPNEDGVTQLLLALGQLAVNGISIDTQVLYAGRNAKLFDLSSAPDRRPSANSWWVNGQRAWPIKGELPSHAMRPILEPVVTNQFSNQVPGPAAEHSAVVLEYLRSVREMVDAQRKVMLSYLGTADTVPYRVPEYIIDQAAVVAPMQTLPAAAPAPVAAQAVVPATPVAVEAVAETLDIKQLLLKIVCERTGYPEEMLDLDLDLEADLSIDSIKRVEILGAVAEYLGAGDGGLTEELPDDLVGVKTLRGIIEVLEPLAAGNDSAAEPAALASTPAPAALPAPHAVPSGPVPRYLFNHEPAGHVAGDWPLPDKRIAIAGASSATASALTDEIESAGSSASIWSDEDVESFDALIDLTPLTPDWSSDHVPELFTRLRAALMAGATHILVGATVHRTPTGNGNSNIGPISGGVVGMIKSLRKEWPDCRLRVANFEAHVEPAMIAELLIAELRSIDEVGEVGYTDDGVRWSVQVARADHNGNEPQPLSLNKDSVVLITGGARGITAQVAIELARRYQCGLELVGRTPAPESEEDPDLINAPDAIALRKALIARGELKDPAHIEAAIHRILAEREVRSTLGAIEMAGSRVSYHAIDVRSPEAFGALIDATYQRYGRLDGIIHGAGVIEDKLARDKTPESFARVFETKVNSALTIAEKVRDDVGFVVFFSSIASAFGSRGQTDYAAANDFLDRLAFKMNRHIKGRVLAINWGPWRDAGMVSPELAREYARRGIDLIEPAAGVASFMDELILGNAEDSQVILMRGDPATMV